MASNAEPPAVQTDAAPKADGDGPTSGSALQLSADAGTETAASVMIGYVPEHDTGPVVCVARSEAGDSGVRHPSEDVEIQPGQPVDFDSVGAELPKIEQPATFCDVAAEDEGTSNAGAAGFPSGAGGTKGSNDFDDFAVPAAPSATTGNVDDFDEFEEFASAPPPLAETTQADNFDDFVAPPPAAADSEERIGRDDFDDFASVPPVASALASEAQSVATPLDLTSPSWQQCMAHTLSVLFPHGEPNLRQVEPVDEELDHLDLSEEEREQATRLGGAKTFTLWQRLCLEGVFVDETGEPISRFHWKTSFVRRKLLEALPRWQDEEVEFPRQPADSEDETRQLAERASTGDLTAIATPAVGLAKSEFDSAGAWTMCNIPEAELRALSTTELSYLAVKMSIAAKQAALQLDQWLDQLEQANMDKETHNKMISVMVATAQKKAAHNAAKQSLAKQGNARRPERAVSHFVTPPLRNPTWLQIA